MERWHRDEQWRRWVSDSGAFVTDEQLRQAGHPLMAAMLFRTPTPSKERGDE